VALQNVCLTFFGSSNNWFTSALWSISGRLDASMRNEATQSKGAIALAGFLHWGGPNFEGGTRVQCCLHTMQVHSVVKEPAQRKEASSSSNVKCCSTFESSQSSDSEVRHTVK
jgi:hypothetical protein